MKKRYILGLLLIITGYFIVDNLLVNNKVYDSVKTDVTYVKHENALSMMLETEARSGEYTLETRSSWPTQDDGYIFNSTLSKCENGSKLSWDNDNNAVIMTGNVSDKCYVYFDIMEQTVIDISNSILHTLDDVRDPIQYGVSIYYNGHHAYNVSYKASEDSIITISGNYNVNIIDILENGTYTGKVTHISTCFYDFELDLPLDYCNYNECYTSDLENLNLLYDNDYKLYYKDNAIYYYSPHTTYDWTVYYAIQFTEKGKSPGDWYYFGICIYGCLSENTEAYVYDKKKRKFKKKKICDIGYDDEILCWDFDNGKFTKAKPIWIMKKKTTNKYNLLKFDDGSTLETIVEHRIFNKEKGKFTYPMTSDTPIGTTTFNSKGKYVKLVSKEVIEKPINYYNIITENHYNMFANGILTSCRLNNMYPIEDMKYVYDKKRDNGIDFSEFDENLVRGLRLKEQDIKESVLKSYVENIIKNKK